VGIAACALGLVAGTAGAKMEGQVVLGSADFAPNGHGFGTAHPSRIYNGGDSNGLVRKIHWQDWGEARALGEGRGYQFKPQGGYYRHTVTVQLRASHIGHCSGDSGGAYTKLKARMQKKPGGRFSRWFAWGGSSSICSFA
jgi:hypothetical protein